MKLIDGWRSLWKAWSMRMAALGILLPELLQIIADNTGSLDWLDGGWKSIIRLACLVGVVLARPVKQANLEPKEAP